RLLEMYMLLKSVDVRISLCKGDQFRRDFDSSNAAIWNTCGKTQARYTGAATQFQDFVAGFGQDGGGKHHSIGTGAKAFAGLPCDNAAAEKTVFRKFHQRSGTTPG